MLTTVSGTVGGQLRQVSLYMVLISDKRRPFQFDNIKMQVIIHCNTTENEG